MERYRDGGASLRDLPALDLQPAVRSPQLSSGHHLFRKFSMAARVFLRVEYPLSHIWITRPIIRGLVYVVCSRGLKSRGEESTLQRLSTGVGGTRGR